MRSRFLRRSVGSLVLVGGVGGLLALAKPVTTHGQSSRSEAAVQINGADAVPGEVLVKFRRTLNDQEQQQIGDQIDVDQNERVGGTGVHRIHSRSHTTETLLAILQSDPRVAYAEPDYIVHSVVTPNDPLFGSLWGLSNTGQNNGCGASCFGNPIGNAGADISATTAWDVSTGSRSTVVGVVDTGIDYNHPDLTANVWSAPTAFTVPVGGASITCAAGTHGFNAINNTCDPLDDNDHGSHTSGTIGATGNNGVGVVGVNWVASIMASKFLNASGSGTTAGAINAIEFTIQAKAIFGAGANVRVLSNSWGGGGFSQALLDEINKANTNNILFVAAAGNNGTNNDTTPHYPSSYNAPNMVAVAATDNRDVARIL